MKVTGKAQIFLAGTMLASNSSYCMVSVLGGGCNGMQYNIAFLTKLPTYKTIEVSPNIYVDDMSAPILEDCILDLEETIGSKKIVVKNPNSKSSCSCGSSFSI